MYLLLTTAYYLYDLNCLLSSGLMWLTCCLLLLTTCTTWIVSYHQVLCDLLIANYCLLLVWLGLSLVIRSDVMYLLLTTAYRLHNLKCPLSSRPMWLTCCLLLLTTCTIWIVSYHQVSCDSLIANYCLLLVWLELSLVIRSDMIYLLLTTAYCLYNMECLLSSRRLWLTCCLLLLTTCKTWIVSCYQVWQVVMSHNDP